jgi:hypothetical protein
MRYIEIIKFGLIVKSHNSSGAVFKKNLKIITLI